jgi:uncharacterized protein
MVRQLTPQSTLENLKREAKRWLHALRDNDPDVRHEARARLERAVPDAPPDPALRHVQHALAREHGLVGWAALKNQVADAALAGRDHAARVTWFINNACPDHHVRGGPAHVRALHTSRRILERYPEVAHDSFYTAIVCGDVEEVERVLRERPQAASEKGGPKGWEPLLYLCFTRLSLPAASDNALAIARLLLDHGADPSVYFMAGGSRYTPFVGVVGEGEENRPGHPHRDALARLLLERGAEPYDIQVIYNTGFHGRVLWLLELMYEHSVRLGRRADWDDPEWGMIAMGGYGSGARWMLTVAMRSNDLTLARWILSHGASPNAAPPRAKSMSQRSLYEDAVRGGLTEMAELFALYGASRTNVTLDGVEAYTAACLRLDTEAVKAMVVSHPEYLRVPQPMLIAADRDRDDIVRFLLDLGVSPDVENAQRERGLHMAAYSNSPRVAQLLLERGAEVDPVESNWSNTPLGAAVYSQHPKMIELLGRVSRDIWELAYAGNIERLREILSANPELAKTTSGGHTPLMWLVPDDEARAMEIAMLLLAYGADPTLKTKEGAESGVAGFSHREGGETAADRALRLGLFEVAELLRQAAR